MTAENIADALKDVFALDADAALAVPEKLRRLFDAHTVAGYVYSFFIDTLREHGSLLAALCVILVITATCRAFHVHDRMLSLVSLCAEGSVLLALYTPLFTVTTDFLHRYLAFLTGTAGSLSMLAASGGSPGTASVTASSAAAAVWLCETAAVRIVLPASRVILALSFLSTLSDAVDLDGIIGFLHTFCLWLLGVLFAVFGAVHTLLVRLSIGTDNVLIGTFRVTFAKLIPVAGGMVGESLNAVLGGMKLLRNGAGGLGIAYIILIAALPLLSVAAAKAIAHIAWFAAKLFGLPRHASLAQNALQALRLQGAVVLFAAVGGILLFAAFLG